MIISLYFGKFILAPKLNTHNIYLHFILFLKNFSLPVGSYISEMM